MGHRSRIREYPLKMMLSPGPQHLYNFLEDLFEVFYTGVTLNRWDNEGPRFHIECDLETHRLLIERYAERYRFKSWYMVAYQSSAVVAPAWLVEANSDTMRKAREMCNRSIRDTADIVHIVLDHLGAEHRKKLEYQLSWSDRPPSDRGVVLRKRWEEQLQGPQHGPHPDVLNRVQGYGR